MNKIVLAIVLSLTLLGSSTVAPSLTGAYDFSETERQVEASGRQSWQQQDQHQQAQRDMDRAQQRNTQSLDQFHRESPQFDPQEYSGSNRPTYQDNRSINGGRGQVCYRGANGVSCY